MALDHLLQEDGSSRIVLEDGSGTLLLESATPGGLFLPSLLAGLGSGGPFFGNPLGAWLLILLVLASWRASA
jgi:hypothetical protein